MQSSSNQICINKKQYHVIRSLGSGSSCHMFLVSKKKENFVGPSVQRTVPFSPRETSGENKPTHPHVAIKVMFGAKNISQAHREHAMLCRLSTHRHIISLYDAEVDVRKQLCVLEMEVASGGDLLHYLQKVGTLPESLAALIGSQLFSAVAYAHSQGICHRDIKLENVLFRDNRYSHVLLADWGLAARFQRNSLLSQDCGSLHYAAPEILANQPYYGPYVDAWSLGIMLFALVTGCFPYVGKTCAARLDSILKRKKPSFNRPVSKELQHLIESLLQISPPKRMSVRRALQHPWFKRFNVSLPPEGAASSSSSSSSVRLTTTSSSASSSSSGSNTPGPAQEMRARPQRSPQPFGQFFQKASQRTKKSIFPRLRAKRPRSITL
mmetsp:Transcript_12792/g.19370  ORF Transcript_12792/g.19370 Transcript_12792/m.19370 type:complete len:381 (-) Transcript_12792:144-1286(-)